MNDDIVTRLRTAEVYGPADKPSPLHVEAADEIERLRAAGDALAVAFRTLGGLDVAHDSALREWEACGG